VRQRRNSFLIAACAAVFLLVLCSVQAFAEGPTWGEVRVVEHFVSVHHRADPASPIVRTLRVGDKVRVDFVQPSGWAALFDMTETERDLTKAIGFAELRLLTPLAQAKATVVKAPVHAAVAPKAGGKSAPSPEVKGEVKENKSLLAGQEPSTGPQDPVRITSDKMVYSQNENAVVFLGNVHGTQKDMAIWSNKLTAYFADKDKQKAPKADAEKTQGDFGNKIERIVAEGSVRLVAGKNEGACNQLTYYVADGVLRMEGNPILREGQNTVRGDIIKFYIHENRSEVLSGAQRRVEAIFYSPKGEKK
jgi:lipopolysaccharide export system protein LptA